MLKGYLSMALMFGSVIEDNQEAWKERIIKKYIDSVNLPRKKKKKLRKSLQLEWNIANWNPFNY
jgi:hypothetical protein